MRRPVVVSEREEGEVEVFLWWALWEWLLGEVGLFEGVDVVDVVNVGEASLDTEVEDDELDWDGDEEMNGNE